MKDKIKAIDELANQMTKEVQILQKEIGNDYLKHFDELERLSLKIRICSNIVSDIAYPTSPTCSCSSCCTSENL